MSDKPCPATKGNLVCCYRLGHDTSVFPHRFVEPDPPEELTIDDLGVASRDNDSQAENEGLEAVLSELGIGKTGVLYVAEQRALRVILINRGLPFDFKKMSAVRLTRMERGLSTLLESVWIDGFTTGIRAQRNRKAEE